VWVYYETNEEVNMRWRLVLGLFLGLASLWAAGFGVYMFDSQPKYREATVVVEFFAVDLMLGCMAVMQDDGAERKGKDEKRD
jgi:uncharacterized membrane protein (DUF441 family)